MNEKEKPRFLVMMRAKKIFHDSPVIGCWEYGPEFTWQAGPFHTRQEAVEKADKIEKENDISNDFFGSRDSIVILPSDYLAFNFKKYSLCSTRGSQYMVYGEIGQKRYYSYPDECAKFHENIKKIPLIYDALKSGIEKYATQIKENGVGLEKSIIAEIEGPELVSIRYFASERDSFNQGIYLERLAQDDSEIFQLDELIGNPELLKLFRYDAEKDMRKLFSTKPAPNFNLDYANVTEFVGSKPFLCKEQEESGDDSVDYGPW